MMRRITALRVAAAFVMSTGLTVALLSNASAQGLLASCGKDIETYCSQVAPGEGRMTACLYAHGDKISDACVGEIDTTALQLEATFDAIQWGYEQCSVDIDKHCAETEPGQSRMYRCIKEKSTELSQQCSEALSKLEVRFGKMDN